jgi:hypothetical protein
VEHHDHKPSFYGVLTTGMFLPNNVVIGPVEHQTKTNAVSFMDFAAQFFGTWVRNINDTPTNPDVYAGVIYVAGDVTLIRKYTKDMRIVIIQDFSTRFKASDVCVNSWELPRWVHDIGVYIPRAYVAGFYQQITVDHQFRTSNKPGISHRSGIYLSRVKETETSIVYNIMRCSTTFKAPTDAFTDTDECIVQEANRHLNHCIHQCSDFNHVLAQLYTNTIVDGRQIKAKLPAHSDKTEDMPVHAAIGFATFYDLSNRKDEYDYNNNELARMQFLSKTCKTRMKTIEVLLEPNSLLIIPLHTNQLYTHEIVPPVSTIDKVLTRIEYVMRSSNVEANFNKNTNKTSITRANRKIPQSTGYGHVLFNLNKGIIGNQ